MSRWKRRMATTLLVTATFIAPVSMASAEHDPCGGKLYQLEVDGDSYYLVDNDYTHDSGGIWIYRETNGQQGLQRGGWSAVLGNFDVEVCDAYWENPDTLIF